MRSKMIRVSTRVMATILVAASVITTATPIAHAEENPAVVEEVQVEKEESTVVDESVVVENVEETSEVVEAPAAEFVEVEGQGDVIDDQFVEVEGQGDIIDDQFAVVEGQGDVIDDEPVVVENQEDVIDDELVVENQEDVIDDELVVENQEDVVDDEFAVATEEEAAIEVVDDSVEAEREELLNDIAAESNEAMVKSVVAMQNTSKASTKEKAPKIDMGIHNILIGYHGTRVDYKDLVPGKYYLMQIPRKGKIPTFKYAVVKILGGYTNKGFICDDVMVTFDKYDTNGKLVAKNRKTQVNENIFNMTPNHFYEITDDILVK